jgi:hypothetical protein
MCSPMLNDPVAAGGAALTTLSTRVPPAKQKIIEKRTIRGDRLRTHGGGSHG